MIISRPAVRLSALYGACFASIGIYMPFFPMWLDTRGLDPAVIGVILSLPIVTRVVVTAPLMSLVDRGFSPRTLLTATSLCLALAYLALAFAWGPYAIAALVILMAAAQAPSIPMCDLIATSAVRENARLDYGRMRLWGSITFLLASVAGGYIIAAATPAAVPAMMAALGLMIWGVVRFAVPESPPVRLSQTGADRPAPSRMPPVLWLLIAAAGLVQASHAGVHGFGSLYWREQGFSDPAIGYLWAVGVVAEIVLFAAAGRVVGRASSGVGLLVVGAIAAVARFGLMTLAPGLLATFALQALHGLSFGATHLSAMAALSHLAPAAARGRAQGLLSTGVSLGTASGTVASGLLFQAGGAWVFAAMAALAAFGLLLALLAVRVLASHPHNAGEGG